ncbi:MAG: archaeosortase/exosortase family protein [Planctomycetota bacterium]
MTATGDITAATDTASRNLRLAGLQVGVLVALCFVVFRAELYALSAVFDDPDAAHGLAAPLIIFILLLSRRRALARQLTGGSAWGVVLLVCSMGAFFLSTWPFNYAYPRRAAIVPAIAGAILAVGGWRVLKLCLPMLLILLIAIPTGVRYYAFLIIMPETYTLSAVRATLDMLPGLFVELEGLDLSYFTADRSGTIALGEHHRGAGILLSYLTLGVFVAFARIRPFWQLVLMGAAAPVIVLLCNYVRLFTWGLITIYGGAVPLSPVPRIASSTVALLLAYALFVLLSVVLSRILVEPDDG